MIRYAVMQTTMEVPPVDALRRAFRSVRSLVDSDADTLAQDAYGILVKTLSLDDATTLQGALRREGIETALLPAQLLPQLPAAKYVRRIELGQDVLLIHDPLGKPFPVEWRHLMLIAAGQVMVTEFTRTTAPRVGGSTRWSAGAAMRPGFSVDEHFASQIRTREERKPKWFLELILQGAVARYSLEPDVSGPSLYACLGESASGDSDRDLACLVDRMVTANPRVLLNRGAYFLKQSPPSNHTYPTKNAFYEEITWMLWRAAQTDA